MSLAFARRLKTKITPSSLQDKLVTADGSTLQRRGTAEVTVQLCHLQVRHRFEVINGLRNNVIFGVDFLQNTHCVLDIQNFQVYFYDQAVILPLLEKDENSTVLRTIGHTVVPPHTEMILPVKLPSTFMARMTKNMPQKQQFTAVVEPSNTPAHHNCLVARAVVLFSSTASTTLCRLLNFSDSECIIHKKTPVANITVLPNVVDTPVTDDDDKERRSIHNQTQSAENLSHEKVLYLQGLGIRLNEDKIPPDIFTDFVILLYEFRSVFATSMADLKEPSNLIPARIITIPDHKPVRMRPYRLNDHMRTELDKQLDQLLQSGIIEEDIDSAYASPVVITV